MNWTTEYPTQPGFYWIRNYILPESPDGLFFGPYIGEVSVVDHKFCLAGSTIARGRFDFISAEWFGPILPPEEESECMVGGHPPGCRGHIKQENEK